MTMDPESLSLCGSMQIVHDMQKTLIELWRKLVNSSKVYRGKRSEVVEFTGGELAVAAAACLKLSLR